jgi:hypothetical protein
VSEVANELARLQHEAVGTRITDDPKNPGDFAVVCSLHKVIGRKLNIVEARVLLADHVATHA